MKSLWSFATLGHFWVLLTCLAILAVAWTVLNVRRAGGAAWLRLPSWFLPSLDRKDRRLLLWGALAAVVLAVITGILLPNSNSNDNPLASTYLSGQHGAMAAYETLVRAGYPVERWERPLGELAATAGPDTVVIFAEPFTREIDEIRAVRQIVERGGRVLATGFWGGYLLPGASPDMPREFNFAACRLEPEGLDHPGRLGRSLDGSRSHVAGGETIRPRAVQLRRAALRRGVRLGTGPRGVVGLGNAPRKRLAGPRPRPGFLPEFAGPESWASFLLGRVAARRDSKSNWSFASGPALSMLRIGLPVLALLVLLSFSRRSGPVRELPPPVRTTPIEFIEALGSIYRNAGAASTAVSIAWERFRRHALRLCGMRGQKMGAAELAAVLRRRFPSAGPELESSLAECEASIGNDALSPREALRIVQLLERLRGDLDAAARPAGVSRQPEELSANQQQTSRAPSSRLSSVARVGDH